MSERQTSVIRCVAVFVVVLIAQLVLVSVAGTDIPFYDQWGIEGGWLYPAWIDGTLRPAGLVQPFNDHRILWTHLLNLALFSANGQWDPLVQCVAIALLRATCAAGLAWSFSAAMNSTLRWMVAGGVALAFLPHLAWHTVLWGIESHTYFALGFSLLALSLLGTGTPSLARIASGLAVGGAALLAMGPAALVPVALLGIIAVRGAEQRGIDRAALWQLGAAVALLGAALALRAPPEGAAAWQPSTVREFFVAAGRTLAWPHVGAPVAALALNLPLLALLSLRVTGRRRAAAGVYFVILAGGWSAAVALATAWMRGGGAELGVGVPSRYVDFLIALPLANAWCAFVLARDATGTWRARAPWLAGVWAVFLAIGWVGLSTEVMRRLILPRMRDRDAPVRLIQAFQKTGNVAVFAGQPRLLVPHPNPETSVRAVLADPRMRGKLPPSLQSAEPMGPLSRAVRWLLGRGAESAAPRS